MLFVNNLHFKWEPSKAEEGQTVTTATYNATVAQLEQTLYLLPKIIEHEKARRTSLGEPDEVILIPHEEMKKLLEA